MLRLGKTANPRINSKVVPASKKSDVCQLAHRVLVLILHSTSRRHRHLLCHLEHFLNHQRRLRPPWYQTKNTWLSMIRGQVVTRICVNELTIRLKVMFKRFRNRKTTLECENKKQKKIFIPTKKFLFYFWILMTIFCAYKKKIHFEIDGNLWIQIFRFELITFVFCFWIFLNFESLIQCLNTKKNSLSCLFCNFLKSIKIFFWIN